MIAYLLVICFYSYTWTLIVVTLSLNRLNESIVIGGNEWSFYWLVLVLAVIELVVLSGYKIAGFNSESANDPTGLPINHF
jgi:hypothetical protein